MPTLRDLFDQALALPEPERAAFLVAACDDPALRADVARLLDAAARPQTGWAAREPAQWLRELEHGQPDLRPEPGQRIGPFELQRFLGEGGSALVYRARREVEGVEQVVALKVLRHGLAADSARRQFDRERQVLARLVHPGIARLIDAGIGTRGEAWIALEYIDGSQLLEHARARQLPFRERVLLMLRIARAVAAAHRLLVVHRDLKPANVLVTPEGEVKLLDFGIAKMIHPDTGDAEHTQSQLRAFTPAYAAPEQREGGAVTTATDVYALGVLARELLTGSRTDGEARGAGGTSTARRARHGLHRDMDTILRKATAEEPEQRYEGAAAFAEDLQRLLDGLPVRAHPPSRVYRMRKFAARHRGGVALTTALCLGVLAALSLAVWQAGLARQEAARAQAVTQFLVGLFRAAEDRLPRNQRPTPELLVASARTALAEDPALDDATRAEIATTLAEVSRLGARYDDAASLLAEARLHLAAAPAGDPRLRQLALAEARVQQHRGRHREALAAISALATGAQDPLPLRLDALAVEAKAAYALGEHDRALAAAARRHALAEGALGPEHPDTLRAVLAHGVLMAAAERFREALDLLQPGLARWRRAGLVLDRDYMAAANAEAGALHGLSLLDDALAHSERLLALQRSIYSEPHDVIASTLGSHALILAGAGRTEEAIATHRRSIAMLEQVLDGGHESLVSGHTALGLVLAGVHRLEEAEAAYRRAIDECGRGASASVACARAHANLGMTLYRQGRLAEAESEIAGALARYREVHGASHLNIAVSLSMLANVAMSDQRSDAAVDLSRQALAIMDVIGMGETRDALLMRNSLAAALWMVDRNAEALVEIDRSIEGFDRVQPGQTVRRTMMRVQRAQILQDLGRNEEARRAAEDALALGAAPADLAARTRELLRELSGQPDLFRELDAPP